MLKTITTFLRGMSAKTEDAVQDHFAIDLIDQKIKDGTNSLQAAKSVLAGLIQRERTETQQIQTLDHRIKDLTERARQAIEAKATDLAEEAAGAIAVLEDEAALRKEALGSWPRKSAVFAHRSRRRIGGS